MSDSGLKLPNSTELEGRVREALKVARLRDGQLGTMSAKENPLRAVMQARLGFARIIRILDDGRS